MRKYNLIRSKRKTITLQIKKDATIVVRAPLKIAKKEVDKFVMSNEEWIRKNLKEVKDRLKLKKQFNLDFNDYVNVRGKPAYIKPVKGSNASYEDGNFFLPEKLNSSQIKEVIIMLYKMIAKSHIIERIGFFKEKMNVEPTAIKITSAKTRWGSCSGKNSVNFSWRLIMGDDETIDYVIVHELAHIKQHNHSKEFWKIVESIIPDYIKRKKKLRDLEKKLSVEDWD
jgi:predicted metal-dependent hydrolase